MTFEEAKKILKEEGFHAALAKEIVNQIGAIREFEKPEVCEAIKVANANKLMVCLSPMEWEVRKARLKKEYEKNTKAPAPGEEQPKENGLKAATDAFILQANEIMRLKKKNTELLEAIDKMKNGTPALAESASQFNDALLDEQAKKIAELTKEKTNLEDQITVLNACKKHNDKINRKQIKGLGKEIAKLNGIIYKKNLKIEELRKESSRHLRGKMKMFGENFDLEQELKDKNAVLADVAEELRLSKIREKNLTEVCQKYVKEVEDLREKLADKVVDKIDAQALKSAESALAWKEKLIYYKDMAIADLRKELKAQKGLVNHISKKYDGAKINLNLRMKECEKLEEALEEKTKLVEMVRNGSKEYCEYGIAAEKMIQKMAKDIVNDRPVSPKDYEQYRHWAKGYRFNPQLPERTDEEEKKPNTSKSALDDLKEKAYNSFNAKAHNLGLVGSKDGNGITDQMEEEKKLSLFRDDSVGAVTNQKDCSPVKDTHPTEDNHEEVALDEILECVRKGLEEGYTVSIDKAEEGGDQSATIVECGKDIDDVFEEIKRLCQE